MQILQSFRTNSLSSLCSRHHWWWKKSNQKLCGRNSSKAVHNAAAASQPTAPLNDPVTWHFITSIARLPGLKDVQRHCVHYTAIQKRGRTSYECTYCADSTALCVGDCFRRRGRLYVPKDFAFQRLDGPIIFLF